MSNYVKTPEGYDFEIIYSELETVYRGRYAFIPTVEALSNPSYDFPVLANPNAGVLNAKYLAQKFVISNVRNASVVSDFATYSGTVCGGLNIVLRAMAQMSKSVKLE